MRPPFNRLFARPRRGRLLRRLALLTVVTGLATGWFAVEMEDHGVGILELEFVGSSEQAEEYRADLGDAGRNAGLISLALDYAYLISYGLFLIGASIAVAERHTRAKHSRWAALGPWVAWGALGAAMFDAAENAFLILILAGETQDPWPALATGCAVAKFTLAVIAFLYVLGGWLTTRGVRPEPSPARGRPGTDAG